MNRPSDDQGLHNGLYEKIIGLGEKSIRKSYYPQLRRKIIELEHEIIERKRKEEELGRNYENQSILNALLKLSLRPIPADQLFQMALERIMALSWLKSNGSAAFYFVEDNPETLVLKHALSAQGHSRPSCDTLTFGHCLCGQAARTGRTVFGSHESRSPEAHGHYCVPIQLENITMGVLCIMLPPGHSHDPGEVEILDAIANTLAGIIQKNRMTDEKIKLERQLRQTQKMEAIGVLAGGIAHDFNNLLTPILGYTEMVLQGIPPSDPIAKDLNQVLTAAGLAKDLVRQILTLSRQSEQTLKPLQIHRVVSEALKLLRSTIPSTIAIRSRIEDHGQTVLADPTQIHQVIMNLCTNAYHAMKPKGGILAVSLDSTRIEKNDTKVDALMLEQGDYIVLEVSDTGTGMTPATVEKIFDPYFTTKNAQEGTGLGLSVVHGIIKHCGGNITVYSEPGKGTTFRVYLPSTPSGQCEMVNEVQTIVPTGTEHLLVVDDEKSIADMISIMLRSKGYTVTTCHGSLEALQLFQQNPDSYPLVITDMTMPCMTGTQLAMKLRTIRPGVGLILCTGFSELINKQKAEAIGFHKFLMKPIVMKELCTGVRDVLDKLIEKAGNEN